MAAAFAALLAALPAAALEVPYLSGRVVDEADLVPPGVEARISQRLAAYEAETGTQVAVLTVPSLEGEPIEDYSMRVVETWELGREEVDDGVLLLVARDDRQMRLEVGYGLEYQLTDLASRRILDEVVRPRFRQGDFAGGLEAGTEAIVTVLREGADALPEPEPAASGTLALHPVARLGVLLAFLFLMLPFVQVAVGSEGCFGWILGFFLLPFFIAFPSGFVHPWAGPLLGGLWLVAFLVLRWIYRNRPHPRWMERGERMFGGPPLLGRGRRSGGFFGGGGRGGFGGGGGFSGGGGSFGGGGASSGW